MAVDSGNGGSGSSPKPSGPGDVKLASSGDFATVPPRVPISTPALSSGVLLADRYEILQILGQGGMGAVYKARDIQLDRFVAVKVIRPELANAEGMMERFKQEIVVARQVTHKNVVRIYDLGQTSEIKFITMEFVDGTDLATILHEYGPFAPDEAVALIIQVAKALEAAHAEGIVHRDLKPQNIMRDTQGRVVVMDFGLARSLQSTGMTQTGAVIGTLEYMSPEQALGGAIGPPSDLFTLGLIFYEVLTGKMPFHAESAVASLIRRTQERALPVSDVERSVPRSLSDIVSRCLERDPAGRYQTATELLRDLERWQGSGVRSGWRDRVRVPRLKKRTKVVGISLAVVLALVAAGAIGYSKLRPAPESVSVSKAPKVSLAVLPFHNASSEKSLDWIGTSVAEMLLTDIGQSAELRSVSSERLSQIMRDLRLSADSDLDSATLRRIAGFTNADTIVVGQYTKSGDLLQISAEIRDLKHDRTIPLQAASASATELKTIVNRLARAVRDNLSLNQQEIAALSANAFTPSTNSVEALRAYNEGLTASRNGNHLEARKGFEAATKADPQFALAHARLGQTLRDLGYDEQAEAAARKGAALAEKLPAVEKYLVNAAYAGVTNERDKAIEAYTKVDDVWPDNTDVLFALGSLFEDSGEFDKARSYYGRILQIDPKHVDALLASGRVEIKRDRSQDGLEYLDRGYTLAVQLNNNEAKASILQAQGVAFKLLNRPEDALGKYQESLAIKQRIGQQRGIAVSLNEIAQVQSRLGRFKEALASYKQALSIRREIGDKSGVGDTLLDLATFYQDRGNNQEALTLLKESLQIQRDLNNPSMEALCLNNIGGIYFNQGQYADANTYFERAYAIREKVNVPSETVESLHNLAETDFMMGRAEDALQHYMKALELRRSMSDERGAAIESFSMGTVFDTQARFDAALKAKEDALKLFRASNDRSLWMAEILNGYGSTLAEVNRTREATEALNEAHAIGLELKNTLLLGQTALLQGDVAYYAGDVKNARANYDRAVQQLAGAGNPSELLRARLRTAWIDANDARPKMSPATVRSWTQQAEALGQRRLSIEGQLAQALLMLKAGQKRPAAELAERVQLTADRLGYKLLTARAHFIAASALRGIDDKRADDHLATLRQMLDGIRSGTTANAILQRNDLAMMYAETDRVQSASAR